jgi:hypothetical protein
MLLALALIGACGSPPKANDTVWATVAEIYTPEKLAQPHNKEVAEHARLAGLADPDVRAGRVVRVACAIGTSYVWGSYAYLPAGTAVNDEQVVRVAVRDPGDDRRWGWNPVLNIVKDFAYRGSSPAYRPNLEPIALAPQQRGRYVTVHSNYLIKCRQDD